MSELVFPPNVEVQDETIILVDEGSIRFDPLYIRGRGQTQNFGGQRLKVKRTCFVTQPQLGMLLGWLTQIRGKQIQFWADLKFKPRGAFNGNEVLSNTKFLNTAGWNVGGPTAGIEAVFGALRITRLDTQATAYAYTQMSLEQYATYLARMLCAVASNNANNGPYFSDTGGNFVNYSYAPGTGLRQVVLTVLVAGTGQLSLYADTSNWGYQPGGFTEWPFVTVQRCALVDACPNMLTYSDDFSNGVWTKQYLNIGGANIVGPEGTSDAQQLIETVDNAVHSVYEQATKSAVVQDWCLTCGLHAGVLATARNFAYVYITDLSGNNQVTVSINLTTGAIVSAVSAIGTFSNGRIYLYDMGNGWWKVSLLAKIAAGTTTFYARVIMSDDGSRNIYAGSTTADIGLWRMTLAQSSVPTHPTKTVATALPNGSPQTGSNVFLKGLPISTDGLICAGDAVGIDGEIKIAMADANSDTNGLGHLLFEPEMMHSPANNAPVVIGNALGKFILAGDPTIENYLGKYAQVSLEMEQVY